MRFLSTLLFPLAVLVVSRPGCKRRKRANRNLCSRMRPALKHQLREAGTRTNLRSTALRDRRATGARAAETSCGDSGFHLRTRAIGTAKGPELSPMLPLRTPDNVRNVPPDAGRGVHRMHPVDGSTQGPPGYSGTGPYGTDVPALRFPFPMPDPGLAGAMWRADADAGLVQDGRISANYTERRHAKNSRTEPAALPRPRTSTAPGFAGNAGDGSLAEQGPRSGLAAGWAFVSGRCWVSQGFFRCS